MSLYQAPTGTRDVLAPESARVEWLVATFSELCRRAGYGLVISPMFEDPGVFRHGVGEESEVVNKEMYEFEDKGGRHLALRPEGTASIMRAYLQHRPTTPWKAWYVAPMFRYERPQAGRYRQHHQLGCEAIGSADPDLDVEIIAHQNCFYEAVGLSGNELHLNSLGDATCRPAYRELLLEYLRAHADELCDEHRKSFERNPLRVLDCKRPDCQAVTKGAPVMLDHLCQECAAAFGRVREGLEALGFVYVIDTRLVRGLDYYTRTTFEFIPAALESAENAVGGGGRYDGLAAVLGGPDTPAVGFGLGIERVLLAIDALGEVAFEASGLDCFVVDLTGGAAARDLTAELRRNGLAAERAFDDRSLRAQLRLADRSGAKVAAIIGSDELAAGTVTLRRLGDGEQKSVARNDTVSSLKELLV